MKALAQAPAMGRRYGQATSPCWRTIRCGAILAGLLALSSVVALPAQASYLSGVLAYRDGRYEQALQAWSPLARAGDASAQFSIGVMYYEGTGVERDPVRAYVWFARAAANGEPLADEMLGGLAAELTPQQLARAQQMLEEGS